ncbi:helix-turn-helix transcriptional regulator [Streptomyces sp. NPDC002018]|uniref:helix-turn-helix domain-containing protein n=1 Tax=Streptomyces sp. NPDC002018 TaxID=3364629 RepID=UPI00368F20A7
MGGLGGMARSGRVRDAAVRAAVSARSVEDFFDGVAGALVPALRLDIWAGITVDPETLMNTGGNYRDAVPAALMPRMLDIEYREGDVNALPDLARRPVPVGLLSQEVGGRLEHSPRYRDIAGPLGFRDELRVLLRDRHGAWGALVLGRGHDAPAFEPVDLALAGALAQPLGNALRRLHLTRQAQDDPSPTAPGMVLLDEEYGVVHMTPTIPMWFDTMSPSGALLGGPAASLTGPSVLPGGPAVSLAGPARSDSGPPPGDVLPPAVYAVAAAVRAPGADSSLTSWVHSRTRGQVRLHAWRMDGLSGARVAVVVEPAGPGEHVGLIVAAYGLTARERHITQLVLRGHSTAEIAHLAGLSPHTVQDHLKSVFDKTGVRSRRDLVATLFTRHYEPALTPSTPPPTHASPPRPSPPPPSSPRPSPPRPSPSSPPPPTGI